MLNVHYTLSNRDFMPGCQGESIGRVQHSLRQSRNTADKECPLRQPSSAPPCMGSARGPCREARGSHLVFEVSWPGLVHGGPQTPHCSLLQPLVLWCLLACPYNTCLAEAQARSLQFRHLGTVLFELALPTRKRSLHIWTSS